MKGKLTHIAINMLVCLAMVLGLVAAFTPTVAVADTVPNNTIVAMIQPSQAAGNLALNTSILELAQAVDGTLFAGVFDDSGERWDIVASGEQKTRNCSVYYSAPGADNGYVWTRGFIIPWDDNTSIVEIVPVPDYANPGIVYIATARYVYVSSDGGKTASRINAAIPGVIQGDVITSMDVAKNCDASGISCATCGYVCAVGTKGSTAPGVYAYNEDGFATWRDKEIGNQPAAGSKWTVWDVRLNPRWNADAERVYVAYACDGAGNDLLTVRGTLGTWGVEALDAVIKDSTSANVVATQARIEFADDYNWKTNPISFIAVVGTVGADAYRVTSVQSPGAPSVKDLGLNTNVYDIAVEGTGMSARGIVAIEDPTYAGTNQCQVFHSTNIRQFSPSWQPSHKPPVGGVDAHLVWSGTAFIGTENESASQVVSGGATPSGVSKMASDCTCTPDACSQGMAWNGVGLLDTIIAYGDYLETYNELDAGLSWLEASPSYCTPGDQTIFMVSNDKGNCSKYGLNNDYIWRTTDASAHWDMVLAEDLDMPFPKGTVIRDMDLVVDEVFDWMNHWTNSSWSVRTVPDFNYNATDCAKRTIFMLGAFNGSDGKGDEIVPWIWRSTDAGNTWSPIIAMPTLYGTRLMQTGWTVVDANTIIVSDDAGFIYMTETNGFAWTDGAPTVTATPVTNIKFYEDPTLGTVVLAGCYDRSEHTASAWITVDNCENFYQVGHDFNDVYYDFINGMGNTSTVMIDFDPEWSTNRIVYIAYGGFFDDWRWDPTAYMGNDWMLYETGECAIWRTEVNMDNVRNSLWDELIGRAEFDAYLPAVDQASDPSWAKDHYRFLYPTALEVSADGTIYVPFIMYDNYYDRIVWGGFWRCLDGSAAETEWAFIDENMPRFSGMWLMSAVPCSTRLFTIGLKWDYYDGYDLWDTQLLTYYDTLSGAGPAAGGPLDGAQGVGVLTSDTSCNVPLTWAAKTGATQYMWEVSEDDGFTNPTSGTTSGTGVTVVGLKPATEYYWRVRCIEPELGRFNDAQKFATIPGGETGAPKTGSPENGATITDTTPLFTWDKIPNATNYELQVATDPGFGASDIVINKTLGDISAYEDDKELVNGTYYWRVRGTNPATDTASPWSFGSFTLDTEAEGGAGTPVWVWVLIIVGVVLAIIVLVLILRTRRPV